MRRVDSTSASTIPLLERQISKAIIGWELVVLQHVLHQLKNGKIQLIWKAEEKAWLHWAFEWDQDLADDGHVGDGSFCLYLQREHEYCF